MLKASWPYFGVKLSCFVYLILYYIATMWNQIGSTIFPAQKVILHYREWLYSVVSLSGLGKLWNHFGSTLW